MKNADSDPRHRISEPYDVLSPDPYSDVSRAGNELEDSVGAIDPQLVGKNARRTDGFDAPQQRFLREPDKPSREEAAPKNGALEDLSLELADDELDGENPDAPRRRPRREPPARAAGDPPPGGALENLALDPSQRDAEGRLKLFR